MKKITLLLVAVFSLYGIFGKNPGFISSVAEPEVSHNRAVTSAFENRKSNIQVSGSGVVIRNLADDTSGSRHQKFILRISSEQTVLVAHNIDLAPRIVSLRKGDAVQFYGEYEWNSRGGVVHWTHQDPRGIHKGGWLKHNGLIYE